MFPEEHIESGKFLMPYTRPIRRFYLTPPAVRTFVISLLLAVLALLAVYGHFTRHPVTIAVTILTENNTKVFEMLLNHVPDLKNWWVAIEGGASGIKRVMVIETDIEIDATEPGHDKERFDELVNVALACMRVDNFDGFHIRQLRRPWLDT
jgi:hypothetical protein